MKNCKRILPALFAAMLVISTLAGCGKKNDEEGVIGHGVGVGVYPGYNGGQPVAASFAVGGSLSISNATGWIYGSLAHGGGAVGGTPYVRTNQSGDQIVLHISGVPQTGGVGFSTVQGYATVYLSQSTMAYAQLYCGGQPTGIAFPSGASLVAGAPNGTISGQVVLLSGGGQQCLLL